MELGPASTGTWCPAAADHRRSPLRPLCRVVPPACHCERRPSPPSALTRLVPAHPGRPRPLAASPSAGWRRSWVGRPRAGPGPLGAARHSVSVAAAIINQDGQLLAVRRRDNGHWEPPGGVLELDETIQAGLVREVLEETGLRVEPGPSPGSTRTCAVASSPSYSAAASSAASPTRPTRSRRSHGSHPTRCRSECMRPMRLACWMPWTPVAPLSALTTASHYCRLSRAWSGPRAALVAGASFSHHAQGGRSWPYGAGMPAPSRKRPPTKPGT